MAEVWARTALHGNSQVVVMTALLMPFARRLKRLEMFNQQNNLEGHESIFCEGECQEWMHKRCAGLAKHALEFYSDPTRSIPFQCPHCKLQAQDT